MPTYCLYTTQMKMNHHFYFAYPIQQPPHVAAPQNATISPHSSSFLHCRSMSTGNKGRLISFINPTTPLLLVPGMYKMQTAPILVKPAVIPFVTPLLHRFTYILSSGESFVKALRRKRICILNVNQQGIHPRAMHLTMISWAAKPGEFIVV